jgi:hypothetical protein
MLLAFLHGIKYDFLDFPGETSTTLMDKSAKLAKVSKMTVP